MKYSTGTEPERDQIVEDFVQIFVPEVIGITGQVIFQDGLAQIQSHGRAPSRGWRGRIRSGGGHVWLRRRRFGGEQSVVGHLPDVQTARYDFRRRIQTTKRRQYLVHCYGHPPSHRLESQPEVHFQVTVVAKQIETINITFLRVI